MGMGYPKICSFLVVHKVPNIISTIKLCSADVRVALGGNAPVMARRFALEGAAQVLLAAKMSPKFKENTHQNIIVTGEGEFFQLLNIIARKLNLGPFLVHFWLIFG